MFLRCVLLKKTVPNKDNKISFILQISTINSKHRQKAVISPYSRTLPAYNAQTNTAFWQHPPPPIGDYWSAPLSQSIVSQPPPPLPTMPSLLDIDEPMPPPPPSTTPPPLQPDEKLIGRTNQQRKYQGKSCNSISFKIGSKSVYSSPAINYVNNNITRSQQSQQPSTHLKYNHNSSMTNNLSSGGNRGSTNSMSENSLLLKTVGSFDAGFINGYTTAADDNGIGGSSVNVHHEKGELI